jgi:hypothetical protein
MPKSLTTKRDSVRWRLRSAVTTVLLIMLSVMIVRDILVRRWGSAAPAHPDVTQRSR